VIAMLDLDQLLTAEERQREPKASLWESPVIVVLLASVALWVLFGVAVGAGYRWMAGFL
jgi:hypothetical protein